MSKKGLNRVLGIVLLFSSVFVVGVGCNKRSDDKNVETESSDGDLVEFEEAVEHDTGESEDLTENLEPDADKADGDNSEAELSDESAIDQDKDSEYEVDADSGDTEAADESVVEQEEYVEHEQSADTWRDPATGLVWQKVANQDDPTPMVHDWTMKYCQLLALDGGGWRLPSIIELRSLIRNCPQSETGGSCQLYAVCPGCDISTQPQGYCNWPTDLSGPCGRYWTSTTNDDETFAMIINFSGGDIGWLLKESSAYYNGPLMRCVRDR